MAFIELKNVWQQYGRQVVLERLNLNCQSGEFCTIVGASGCGKSHLPADAARRGAADARHVAASTACRCRESPDRHARRRVPALLGVSASDGAATTCCSVWSSRRAPLHRAAVRRAARREARATGARDARSSRPCRRARQLPGASSPAACSNGWRIAQALIAQPRAAAARRTVRRARSGHPQRHARADARAVARAPADGVHGHATTSRKASSSARG